MIWKHRPHSGFFPAVAAIAALAIATGCGKDNPAAPKNSGTPGIQDGAGNFFVNAATGDDANGGTRSAPFKSIQKAIDVAATGNPRADIYVAYGSYSGAITLRSRMSLHGGYNGSTWVRSLATDSTVVTGAATGMSGNDADSLVIDGFTIHCADAPGAGGSSIGIHLRNGSQGVTIADNRIFAGRGKAGANGANGSSGVGVTGSSDDGADGGGCPNAGGSGQASVIGSDGGDGGDGTLGDGGNGGAGFGIGGGGGGAGGNLIGTPAWGLNGGAGSPGAAGGNGAAGASFGTFSGGVYVPASGTGGLNGAHGGGGGGGGAGTGTLLICGPGGGGGGAGGGGGGGADGGRGGGGSFGVLLVQGSTGSLTNNVIVAANGGDGGNSGLRGLGRTGGSGGGRGAQAADFLGDTTSTAGSGGDGGDGGYGGYGGGGGGGPSIAILEDAPSSFTRAGNQTSTGAAGAGGQSLGNAGPNGESAEFRKL